MKSVKIPKGEWITCLPSRGKQRAWNATLPNPKYTKYKVNSLVMDPRTKGMAMDIAPPLRSLSLTFLFIRFDNPPDSF